MTTFMIVPMLPKIIVTLGLANISAPAQFSFPCDLYIDSEKYYFVVLLETCSGCFMVVTSNIAVDVMFIVFVQHACGIFAAIG